MTHRSRSGGPTKNRGKKNASQRKLHHPPSAFASASASTSTSTSTEEEEDPRSFPLPARTVDPNPPDSELLALIHRALHSTLSDESFIPTIQKIKGLLYDKKWLDVFCGSESLLEAYAGRWVPSRVCCFRELMEALVGELFELKGKGRGVEERLGGLALDDVQEDEEEDVEKRSNNNDRGSSQGAPSSTVSQDTPVSETTHILSLGGGAGSEILAIAALIRSTVIAHPHKTQEEIGKWSWTGVDIGRWKGIIDKFTHATKVDWEVDESILEVDYIQGDLVAQPQPSDDTISTSTLNDAGIPSIDLPKILLSKPPQLITLFFTLTELLSQSRSSTLTLLSQITEHTPAGTQFLIIDSASDISQLPLGKEGRSYPIYMVIDLLLTAKGKGWEKVRGEDSRWFRFDEDTGKGWPCKLENTRYWYRLYRRI